MENDDRLCQSAVLGKIEGDYLMIPQNVLLAQRAYYQLLSTGLESYLRTIEEIETLCQENL